MILFSVIVPVYKVEQYIDKCINSILNQTYRNFELILIDDGSPDNSGYICDKYSKLDDRIKVIHQKNQGVSSARNNGIFISQGEYLCFVDSDDWISENTLELLAADIAYKHAEVIVFGYNVVLLDRKESFLPDASLKISEIKENFICTAWKNFSCNKCYKRGLFKDTYFPIGKYYEDEYIIPQIIYSAITISVVPKALYYYNQENTDSITHSTSSKKEYDLLVAVIKNYEFAKCERLECENRCLDNVIEISQRVLMANSKDGLLTEGEKSFAESYCDYHMITSIEDTKNRYKAYRRAYVLALKRVEVFKFFKYFLLYLLAKANFKLGLRNL